MTFIPSFFIPKKRKRSINCPINRLIPAKYISLDLLVELVQHENRRKENSLSLIAPLRPDDLPLQHFPFFSSETEHLLSQAKEGEKEDDDYDNDVKMTGRRHNETRVQTSSFRNRLIHVIPNIQTVLLIRRLSFRYLPKQFHQLSTSVTTV